MKRLALSLAFFSSGIAPLVAYLESLGIPNIVLYPDRVMCLPALIISLGSWWRVKTFARSLPVVACMTLMLAGVLWVDPTEQGRAWLVFAAVATSVPIAALVVEAKACRYCAKVFIAAAVGSLLLIAILQGVVQGDVRFGQLVLNDTLISDPNHLAAQLGVAAILAVSLMQQKDNRFAKTQRSLKVDPHLPVVLALLTIGILLTASRSGIISLFVILILFAFSRNTKVRHRIAIFLAGLMTMTAILLTDNQIASRLQESHEVLDFGSRLPIWETGIWILQSDSNYLFYGVGTGGIDKALAENSLYKDTFRRGEDGILRRASHNAYIEWLVSYGLLGAMLGLWLLVAVIKHTRRLDQLDRSFDRRSLLAYCLVASFAAELYRLPFATSLCALLLAMLSGPFLVSVAPQQAQTRCQQRFRGSSIRRRIPSPFAH